MMFKIPYKYNLLACKNVNEKTDDIENYSIITLMFDVANKLLYTTTTI